MRLDSFKSTWVLLRESAVFWTGIAFIVWIKSATVVQDLLVFGAFVFALFHAGRGAGAWKQPAGIAFIVVLVYSALTLPFSTRAVLSLRDASASLDLLAGMFAIPVLFNTRARIQSALLFSAAAVTLTLGCDLVRLAWVLGPDLMAKAHAHEPFILNHSNVASMMAGASAFVLFYFFWIWRRRRRAAAACLLGALLCAAYLVVLASRGPQIAFAMAVACSGLLLPGWRRKVLWLAVVAVAAGVALTQAEHINRRFGEKKSMLTLSSRDIVWKHTWQLSRAHPVFGYGYGKRCFNEVYYGSHPPPSPFRYPHCHQFWLKLLFEFGWTGLALHAAAWLILAVSLLRHIASRPTFEERLLPGTIGLVLLLIHFYGLGDYPDNVVRIAQFWLIPLALALMSAETTPADGMAGGLTAIPKRRAP